jgi:hypothetical protein
VECARKGRRVSVVQLLLAHGWGRQRGECVGGTNLTTRVYQSPEWELVYVGYLGIRRLNITFNFFCSTGFKFRAYTFSHYISPFL